MWLEQGLGRTEGLSAAGDYLVGAQSSDGGSKGKEERKEIC